MLCTLAKKYNVDKCPNIISKYPTHTYTPIYNLILGSMRNSTKNVLEIGIGNVPLMSGIIDNYKPGCSLRMWRDYFPSATIYGCDIDTSVLFTEDRIKTFPVDQSSEVSLENMITTIDVSGFEFIIDDGSHIPDHQEISFKALWKHVRVDGIYIIEDVAASSMERMSHLPEKYGFSNCECIYKHYGSWGGDNFVAFRKSG
jgi:hypothetical protein